MNSYERIQAAVDYIEDHLTEAIQLEQVASAACFSLSHFYRIFHALVGHSVKEYIRKRRLSDAATGIITTDEPLIQISFDYQFESQESFTKAFKTMYGLNPGRYRRIASPVAVFPRLNIIEKYLASDPVNSLDPKIKVLKRLKPVRVASYRAFGETPEIDAWKILMAWADRNNLLDESRGYRVFGFDNPGPEPEQSAHGYEFYMTIEDPVKLSEGIMEKTFPGGLYAVTGTTVAEIGAAWDHFVRWLSISRYRPGPHQCLEEHLSMSEIPGENTPIDLYLPIKQPK